MASWSIAGRGGSDATTSPTPVELVQEAMRPAQSEPTVAEGKPRLYRLTLSQVLRMARFGIFRSDKKFELLGGLLVEKMSTNPPHSYAVIALAELLRVLLLPGRVIREEKPISLGRKWAPEPDIAIVQGPNSLYQGRFVRAADIAFLVEVSDTTYATDRGSKWRRYAALRIPAYWIVNLDARRVEVYRDPSGRGRLASYRTAEVYVPGAEIPVIVEGREAGRVAVDEILPQVIRP